jgi:hypothetical protein
MLTYCNQMKRHKVAMIARTSTMRSPASITAANPRGQGYQKLAFHSRSRDQPKASACPSIRSSSATISGSISLCSSCEESVCGKSTACSASGSDVWASRSMIIVSMLTRSLGYFGWRGANRPDGGARRRILLASHRIAPIPRWCAFFYFCNGTTSRKCPSLIRPRAFSNSP